VEKPGFEKHSGPVVCQVHIRLLLRLLRRKGWGDWVKSFFVGAIDDIEGGEEMRKEGDLFPQTVFPTSLPPSALVVKEVEGG